MSIRSFLDSHIRTHRSYPSLKEIREGLGDSATDEDIAFLAAASEIPDEYRKNADYQIISYMTYQDTIDSILDLYTERRNQYRETQGEW